MLLINHVAVGAVIAEGIPNIWAALILAFLSHFVFDMIPHAQAPTDEGYIPNKRTYLFVALDVISVIAFLVYFRLSISALIIVFFAILPDLLDLTRYNSVLYRTFKFYYDFHDKVQKETNKPIGFVTQICLLLTCLLILWVIK